MTTTQNTPKPRTTIARSDMDDQGMVTVWDRGPSYGAQPDKSDEEAVSARKAEIDAWKRDNADAPVALRMHAHDAVHAVQADPERYALDAQAVDESEVAAEVKKIQDARAAGEKADLERAAAVQLAEDRKTAIAAIMARRKAPPRDGKAAMARRDEIGAAAANREAADRKPLSEANELDDTKGKKK